jgi:hypothetical protein
MLELDGIAALLLLAFWLYCLYDVITSDESSVRNLPRLIWLFLVLVLPDIGGLAWLLLGRPARAWSPTFTYGNQARQTPRGPDDDTDFLHRVDRERSDRLREAELALAKREEELRRREAELRQREQGES